MSKQKKSAGMYKDAEQTVQVTNIRKTLRKDEKTNSKCPKTRPQDGGKRKHFERSTNLSHTDWKYSRGFILQKVSCWEKILALLFETMVMLRVSKLKSMESTFKAVVLGLAKWCIG